MAAAPRPQPHPLTPAKAGAGPRPSEAVIEVARALARLMVAEEIAARQPGNRA